MKLPLPLRATGVLAALASVMNAVPCLGAPQLVPVATGLPSPVAITHAGDGSGRLFITALDGRVFIHTAGQVLPTPFMDLRSLVLSGGEQGLLSIAFHPDYESNGFVFVDYTRQPDGATVIARYRVSAVNPNLIDPATAATLLVIGQPFSNHNGGQLQFGPDGYLYVALGDGGSGGDPSCFAQRTDTLLGKILRLDVDQNVATPPFHGIPTGNPWAGPGDPRPDEVWALGLRNPWRFSFDRLTGDMFIGDVGQNQWEEVDFEPAGGAGGINYGWKVMEGSTAFSTANCPPGTPAAGHPSLVLPTVAWTAAGGGTFVLNTSAVPGLAGASGSLSVTSDAPYGTLAGKAVVVEPATGLSFDTPLILRSR